MKWQTVPACALTGRHTTVCISMGVRYCVEQRILIIGRRLNCNPSGSLNSGQVLNIILLEKRHGSWGEKTEDASARRALRLKMGGLSEKKMNCHENNPQQTHGGCALLHPNFAPFHCAKLRHASAVVRNAARSEEIKTAAAEENQRGICDEHR